MAIINIETATSVSSVAVSEKGRVIFERISYEAQSHASSIGVFVDEAIASVRDVGLPVEAVAVSGGPGSYTGLRIGVSIAKGLCFGWDIPLLNIPTLDILATKAIHCLLNRTDIQKADVDTLDDMAQTPLFCAMIDARRMEVYAALYNSKLQKIHSTQAQIITAQSYADILQKQTVIFIGSGAYKCKEIIQSPNALFLDDIHPFASDMALLSEQALTEKRFENVAYFEPYYLKEFQATIPKSSLYT